MKNTKTFIRQDHPTLYTTLTGRNQDPPQCPAQPAPGVTAQ